MLREPIFLLPCTRVIDSNNHGSKLSCCQASDAKIVRMKINSSCMPLCKLFHRPNRSRLLMVTFFVLVILFLSLSIISTMGINAKYYNGMPNIESHNTNSSCYFMQHTIDNAVEIAKRNVNSLNNRKIPLNN